MKLTPCEPRCTISQRDPVFGTIHDVTEISRVTGIPLPHLRTDVPTQTVSTGLPMCVVPLTSLAALQGLRLNWASARAYLEKTDARFFYFVTRETVNVDAHLQARQIFYNGEDPATGSAAGCTAAWMVRHNVAPSGQRVMIDQGLEMRRPSRIHVRATLSGDVVTDVYVGGFVVEVARGSYTLL
ncbi:MAG: PhzF family phenazine biosynthesis protein [Myxococcota bacterium]